MTLNELCDDILLEARNNQITESEKLSKRQIQLWIQTYRAFLLKQELDKEDEALDDAFTQYINMHLSMTEDEPGHYEYVSDEDLPTLLSARGKIGVLSVKDAFGNLIQIGSETKMKYQRYRKYTCDHYIAYVKGNKLYVEGGPNLLENVEVKVIAEDPTELTECYNPDTDEYPIPAYMWSTLKDLIFNKEFRVMVSQVSDVTNDSNDGTQNQTNTNLYKAKR